MYVKAFDDRTIPDTETMSLTHLPDQVRWPTVTVDPAKLNQLPTASPGEGSTPYIRIIGMIVVFVRGCNRRFVIF